jgi:hypothetical protein
VANLNEAKLRGANLYAAQLVDTDFTGADLTGCRIFGISAWRLKLERAKQHSLVITGDDEPIITVDNIEVAQFIYLLLHNEKIRDVIDTVTSKAVLILGRFTEERKPVLDAIREELRKRDYLPILFDFAVPATRDITETVSLLARMARFIIADLTDPSSIPKELEAKGVLIDWNWQKLEIDHSQMFVAVHSDFFVTHGGSQHYFRHRSRKLSEVMEYVLKLLPDQEASVQADQLLRRHVRPEVDIYDLKLVERAGLLLHLDSEALSDREALSLFDHSEEEINRMTPEERSARISSIEAQLKRDKEERKRDEEQREKKARAVLRNIGITAIAILSAILIFVFGGLAALLGMNGLEHVAHLANPG